MDAVPSISSFVVKCSNQRLATGSHPPSPQQCFLLSSTALSSRMPRDSDLIGRLRGEDDGSCKSTHLLCPSILLSASSDSISPWPLSHSWPFYSQLYQSMEGNCCLQWRHAASECRCARALRLCGSYRTKPRIIRKPPSILHHPQF